MVYCLKMISSSYCWVGNRLITVTNGVVESLEDHIIIDWSCAIGITTFS